MHQSDWIKKHYKSSKPWICKCNNPAFLHTCIKGKHEFWCLKCVFEYDERNEHANFFNSCRPPNQRLDGIL